MKKSLATIAALTAVLALSACGTSLGDGYGDSSAPAGDSAPAGGSGPAGDSAPTPTPSASQDDQQDKGEQDKSQAYEEQGKTQIGQAGPKVLKVQQVRGLTPIVTSASGRTVYRFDNDSANPSKSTCFDACATTWEPVLAGTGVEIDGGGIDERQLGTIERPEGQQVTLKGWPLYYFKDDVKLGQLAGQGRGGVWFAVNPKGGKAKSTAKPAATPPAQKDVQTLTVNVVDGFMPFVTNQAGRTIYRFDNDSANPSRTTCSGACTKKWEPVLVGKNGVKILSSKIDRAAVGTIDRPEGKQVTLNGWPLYYFHQDKVLGQTAGYGVGNVWFAIAPNGKKAVRCL